MVKYEQKGLILCFGKSRPSTGSLREFVAELFSYLAMNERHY